MTGDYKPSLPLQTQRLSNTRYLTRLAVSRVVPRRVRRQVEQRACLQMHPNVAGPQRINTLEGSNEAYESSKLSRIHQLSLYNGTCRLELISKAASSSIRF